MIKVRISFIGAKPKGLQLNRARKWKSQLFTIDKTIDEYILDVDSDLDGFGYSDAHLSRYISSLQQPANDVDLDFYVLDVPIEDEYISRIISGKRILVSYNEVSEYLREETIPQENMLLMLIYTYVLLYISCAGKELSASAEEAVSHDERRGCIYDRCGELKDIVDSCIKPGICQKCEAVLTSKGVKAETVAIARCEMERIDRTFNQKALLYANSHPLLKWVMGATAASLLGVIIKKWID